MKYDFTSIMDRKGKDAIAIDGLGKMPGFTPTPPKEGFDAIPMWVADMNFPTVPTITEAIIERTKHPAFGYFNETDEYFNSIIKWHETRNDVTGLKAEHIGYENGVLGGVLSALDVFCSKGDNVLLHSPTYIGFTMSLGNNGYNIVHTELVKDENDVYRMDFEDMERCIIEKNIHATIFCSPHNPTGRVWEKWEIEKAMEIFEKHNVYVVSDEIWSDIILTGNKHIPTQSVSEYAKEHTVGVYAPSKTFNLAGLVGSYHIIYSKWIRDRVMKQSSLTHYNNANVLSMHALIGAYKPEGYEWVDELREVVTGNINYACDYIAEHFDGVKISKPEGTYMLFVDCTEWCEKNNKTIDEVEQAAWNVGVAVQDGAMFHGPCHMRINLALPLSRVKEAFDRLDKYVFNAEIKEVEGEILKENSIIENFSFNTPFEMNKNFKDLVNEVEGKTALVFLRYFGCTLCQMDVHNIIKNYDKIKAENGQVVIVFQSKPETIAANTKKEDLPFEIICDPDAALYEKYEVKASKTRMGMVDKKTMVKVMKATAAGFKHGAYEGDEQQLPATFIINKDMKVTYAHYGKSAGDTPNVDEIVEILK